MFIDYRVYKEVTAKSKAKQAAVDKLAKEVKRVGGLKTEVGLLKRMPQIEAFFINTSKQNPASQAFL